MPREGTPDTCLEPLGLVCPKPRCMQAPDWCATEFHPFHTRRPPPDPDKSIPVAAICFTLVVDAHMTLQHHLSSLALQQKGATVYNNQI
eukprot:scaffold11931_cov56-Cyclotella_meneghiniana.AAC.1